MLVSSYPCRASSSRVDRASVVLVTRNLRLRCDSLVSGSDLASVPSRSLTDDGRQPSGATPCSNLRCDAAFALPEGARPRAGNADVPQTPPAAAQLSFQDWTAALQRSSGISNPLARPPLPLTPPGDMQGCLRPWTCMNGYLFQITLYLLS